MEFLNNWREEKNSAYLYSIMATHEKNHSHIALFINLQAAAEKQASLWEKKLRKQSITIPIYKPSFRVRLIAFLIRYLGIKKIHFILSAMKIRGMSIFTHIQIEHKHTSFNAASNLRAAVFGVNDGLISNMSLILGIAGANANNHFIVLAGIAGLLAGACSMGAGEYISVRSQREVFEYQIAIERQELSEYPEEEMEELSLIYQARGIPKSEADKLATIMIQNPETGLNTLVREELGLNPDELVSPIGAMFFSFFSFAFGAFIPLLPYFFVHSSQNLLISMFLTGLSLFMIGSILSLFTNRNPWILGLRMLLIGCAAGGVSYLIGKILGITVY